MPEAQAAAKQTPQEAPKPAVQMSLPPSNFATLEVKSTTFHAIIPRTHTKEMVLQPEYWMHVARKVRVMSKIEVAHEDWDFYGVLVVMQCGNTWAKVWPILWATQDTKVIDFTPERAKYKINSGANGYRIILKETGAVISDGHPRKDDAERALDVYLVKLGQQ